MSIVEKASNKNQNKICYQDDSQKTSNNMCGTYKGIRLKSEIQNKFIQKFELQRRMGSKRRQAIIIDVFDDGKFSATPFDLDEPILAKNLGTAIG